MLTVSGSVWEDTNGDGDWDTGEPPIADFDVYVDLNRNGSQDSNEPIQATDNNGFYEFTDLQPGPIVVRAAETPGYEGTYPGPDAGGYYGSAYRYYGEQIQLVHFDSEKGQVTWIGDAMPKRMHGLVVTNSGEFYGVNCGDQSFYQIDADTGWTNYIGITGYRVDCLLAYDPTTDTIYGVGKEFDSEDKHLLTYNRTTGAATRVDPVGGGIEDPTQLSGADFDPTNNTILVYNNGRKGFYAFDRDGQATTLADVEPPMNTWAMAHNGTGAVFNGLSISDGVGIDMVSPQTGARLRILNLSERAPMEALEYVPSPFAHAVHATSSADFVDKNFGQKPYAWHHHANPMDVDDDDHIVPLDALLIVNYLNEHPGDSSPPPPPAAPPPYYDVSGDGHIVPLDALLVINYLSKRAGGEGESLERIASPSGVTWVAIDPLGAAADFDGVEVDDSRDQSRRRPESRFTLDTEDFGALSFQTGIDDEFTDDSFRLWLQWHDEWVDDDSSVIDEAFIDDSFDWIEGHAP